MGYKKTFTKIMGSNVFRTDGKNIDLTKQLTKLGNQVAKKDNIKWELGEGLECDLSSLIVGAYWSLTEWHGGQYSGTYAALSSLGTVFSPGMECGPEEGTSEQTAYELINEYYGEQNK